MTEWRAGSIGGSIQGEVRMISWIKSGELRFGVVMAIIVITIPIGLFAGGGTASRELTAPVDRLTGPTGTRVALPLPRSEGWAVEFAAGGLPLESELIETAYIRNQRIGVFDLGGLPGGDDPLDIRITYPASAGKLCVDAGPLSRLCSSVLAGYSPPASTRELGGPPGTVTRCRNLNECKDCGPDLLMIVGDCIYSSTFVDSLAELWSERMGLNVAAINVSNISLFSPVEIRNFIRDLYSYQCAEHFGDGHLGFVVLLGDAYEDDLTTAMVPEYDGYGGTSEASDHFYACVSGTDDYEDLMIGRIPVGNTAELESYYYKLAGYAPLPEAAWTKKIHMAAGCYYFSNDDYVTYFDSLSAYVPEDFTASRFYRYDYPASSPGDAQAMQAMEDSLNAGKLFVLYSGDGDKWDWGGLNERVFRSNQIPDLVNGDRLPIVFSISCGNGWFDNITDTYDDGGVDCLAERLLLAEDKGAIACLASSRAAGGGASEDFFPRVIKAAFVNGSSYLGELILEAKTQHLINLGKVEFVRQFNLFGDPCLNFVLHNLPLAFPDLVLRPFDAGIGPEFPKPGETVDITAEIWNASGVAIEEFDVGLYSAHPDSGGVLIGTQTIEDYWPWERRSVTFSVSEVEMGVATACLVVDPAGSISELDETNNTVELTGYIYPCEAGFPVKISDRVEGQAVSDLDGDGIPDILVTSGGTHAQAVSAQGVTLWMRDDLGMEEWFEGIEPCVFDLNGDGAVEAIVTTRSAIIVLEGATGNTLWKRYTDYAAVTPVVSDLDGDGSFEIVMASYTSPFSKIYAFDASGTTLWIHDLPTFYERITDLVVCDIDLDGVMEIAYCTNYGNLACLRTTNPPTEEWNTPCFDCEFSAMVAGDLERNGSLELVAACDSLVFVMNVNSGSVKSTVPLPTSVSHVSLGNLDEDLELEIVLTSQCGRVLQVDDEEVVLDLETSSPLAGPASLADIDGDGTIETIVALESGKIRILKPGGTDLIPPVPMRGACCSEPTAMDVDLDGNIEVVAGSTDSLLFVLDLGNEGGLVEWACKGGTGTRSGLYAQPIYGNLTSDLALSGRLDAVGDIFVGAGVTLTLRRGTILRFVQDGVFSSGSADGQCEIIVEGSLVASGLKPSGIKLQPAVYPFTSDQWAGILVWPEGEATLSNTIITGAVTAVECESDDICLSECDITGCIMGIKCNGSSPHVDSNHLSGNDYGISATGGAPVIAANVLEENRYAGILLSGSSGAVLEDNRIASTTEGHGLSVYSSSPEILGGNRIESNSLCGIYLSNSSPAIDSCWVAYNGDCGIKAAYYSAPVVSKTSIVGNRYGVGAYIYADPILGDPQAGLGCDNDIRQNTQYAVYNATLNEIRAQENWWGTDSPDPSLFAGQVDFSNWLILSPAGIDDMEPGGFLLGVRPNPFSTRISLSLEVSSRDVPLRAAVYDVRGRLVRNLPAIEATGPADLVWDGRDSYGSRVASGSYIMVLSTPRTSVTRKLILLR
jgi:hypothetical protein